MATVSCIIPCYNEETTLGRVLAVTTAHPGIAEVIVVDDGSTDGTAGVAARHPGTRLIRLPGNGGKTAAVAAGLAAARGDLLLLVDADLEGLAAEDLSRLMAPVAAGSAAMSISLRCNAPWLWRRIGLDYISGERVLARSLLAHRGDELRALPRFGLEVYLNRLAVARGAPLAVVPWPGVRNRAKLSKHGLWRGLRGDAGMLADLFRVCGPAELLNQIRGMRRLARPGAAPPR